MASVQVTGLQLNIKEKFANGKTYDGHKLTYQPQPYQGKTKDPVEKFLFGNSDIGKQLVAAGIQAGDWVEITFEKNGKYSNPVAIAKASAPAPSAVSPNRSPVSSGGGDYQRDDSPDKAARIARAVALDKAQSLIAILAANGGYTAANLKKREYVVEEVLRTARELLPFLNGTETVDGVVGEEVPFDGGVKQDDYEDN
jgi:hypothetical protein